MNEVSERDWELVNAYHDGELGEADVAEFEQRLAAEPELAEALARVQKMSASLGALRPDLPGAVVAEEVSLKPANANKRPVRWVAGVAVAAGFAALVFGANFTLDQAAQPTVFDIHAELAELNHEADVGMLLQATTQSIAGVPDLRSANLIPVIVRPTETGEVAHYAGRNGCRLTYFRGETLRAEGALPDHAQVASWTTGENMRHMVVATGMDTGKFDAITAYLKLLTHRQSDQSTVASVEHATTNAVPCLA